MISSLAGADGADLLILGSEDVRTLLAGRDTDVLAAVEAAYKAHGRGESSLPHSSFLRFPGDEVNRIIALPAYLGSPFAVSGIKWIASYPANLERGLPRASAVVVLNSTATGRPLAILEGATISARRTAASAALAARALAAAPPGSVGLVGTGVINRETVRFLRVVFPEVGRLVVHDRDPERSSAFVDEVREWLPRVAVEEVSSVGEVLSACPLVSFATTAVRPHVEALAACPPGTVVLHVSLRDLSPEAILAADNVVDDPDHVCRAETSVHLAEGRTGGRSFIRATLAEVLEGTARPKGEPGQVTVFSPFGMGILDLAVSALVVERAREEGVGTSIRGFCPDA